jgi:hypothetical protein
VGAARFPLQLHAAHTPALLPCLLLLQAGGHIHTVPSDLGLDLSLDPLHLASPSSEAEPEGLAGDSAASSPGPARPGRLAVHFGAAALHGGLHPAGAVGLGTRAAAARFASFPEVNAAISCIAALGRGGAESFSHGSSGVCRTSVVGCGGVRWGGQGWGGAYICGCCCSIVHGGCVAGTCRQLLCET